MGISLARVVIIGAAGALGSELMNAFADLDPIGLERSRLDIEDPSAIDRVLAEIAPTVVIDTAAFHDVSVCEREPDRAFSVNAVATERLSAACHRLGAKFVYISTDYVFDGTLTRPYREDDTPRPLSVYGVSKLAGERLTLRHDDTYVVRTSGLYGPRPASGKRASFIARILAQARAGDPLRIVEDVRFSPGYTPHVAAMVRRILAIAPPGTYHATSAGGCTWYEFAQFALRAAGLEPSIEPVSHAIFDTTVRRPAYSVLDHGAALRAGVEDAPAWQAGIEAYLAAGPAQEVGASK